MVSGCFSSIERPTKLVSMYNATDDQKIYHTSAADGNEWMKDIAPLYLNMKIESERQRERGEVFRRFLLSFDIRSHRFSVLG